MIIAAGRTQRSRYDYRCTIHLAVAPDSDSPARALCNSSKVIAPITRGPAIDITCNGCLNKLAQLPELLDDPEADPLSGNFLQAV